MKLQILYEDMHILVCVKPSGVPSQSDKTADFDMVNRLKNYLYEKGDCKGQPYIGVVHRLDRPVSGIMVFAKTPFSASELSKQIQQKQFCKKYLAVVTSDLSNKLGEDKELLTDYLVKNGRTNLSSITTEKDKNGKKAQLYYNVKSVKENLSLVEVELLTGRHHQIRVQLKEHIGGIWGDTKYNIDAREQNKNKSIQEDKKQNKNVNLEKMGINDSENVDKVLGNTKEMWKEIALFAYHLEFIHPKTKKKMVFEQLPKKEPFISFL